MLNAQLFDVEKQEHIFITTENVAQQVRTLPNSKVPGTDRVQAYWIKYLKPLHCRVSSYLSECIIYKSLPSWLIEG